MQLDTETLWRTALELAMHGRASTMKEAMQDALEARRVLSDPEAKASHAGMITVDLSQVAADVTWLCEQLLERFPQGLGERIRHLDGFLASIGQEIVQLEDAPTRHAGNLIIRFGLRRRAELLSAALAALEGDISEVNRVHGALR